MIKRKIISILIILEFVFFPYAIISPLNVEEPLTIQFTTFFGTLSDEDGYAMVIDDEGNVIVVGSAKQGYRTALIVKFDSNGKLLSNITLSGNNHITATDVAIDNKGNIVVVGVTKANDFLTTDNAFNRSYSGPNSYPNDWGCCGDGFLTILSNDVKNILYSTYLGGSGSDTDLAVEIDSQNNIYVAGLTTSKDFPITSDTINSTNNGGYDVFLSIFDSDLSLSFSSFIGGSNDEIPRYGIDGKWMKLDSANNVIITGLTNSVDYPVTTDAVNTSINGGLDAFLSKISVVNRELLYSTYFGGEAKDQIYAVTVDKNDDIIVGGATTSPNFPVTKDGFQAENKLGGCFAPTLLYEGKYSLLTCGDTFLAKFSNKSELLYSTLIGGDQFDGLSDVKTDSNGNIYVAGLTYSMDLPITDSAFQNQSKGGLDMYVAKFNSNLSSLLYGTYIGSYGLELLNGIAVDNSDNIYVTGFTTQKSFPEVNSKNKYAGGWDMVLIKFQNRSSEANNSPGFELFSLIGLFVVVSVSVIYRRKIR